MEKLIVVALFGLGLMEVIIVSIIAAFWLSAIYAVVKVLRK
ncbi:hypothetical protein [Lacipirellula sp.]